MDAILLLENAMKAVASERSNLIGSIRLLEDERDQALAAAKAAEERQKYLEAELALWRQRYDDLDSRWMAERRGKRV